MGHGYYRPGAVAGLRLDQTISGARRSLLGWLKRIAGTRPDRLLFFTTTSKKYHLQVTETFSRVERNLIELLGEADNRVIALTGKWGTGKTYLWGVVEKKLTGIGPDSKQPIYVSLFGAKTINELKLRILQNAYLKDRPAVQKLIKVGSRFGNQLLKRFTGYSAEDAALLWLPTVVFGKLVVIDDIERKHKSLDIDELLGLLDEYSQTHDTRFLILLNTDKLHDAEMWTTLHEKVIDMELILNPSVTESFDVATQGNTGAFPSQVQEALTALNVNNIRVIKRLLRIVSRISKVSGVGEVPPSRWVPSTVLLTACHYRAVENAPPFEYLKSFNSYNRMFRKADESPNPTELKWDELLEKMGIQSADAYEEIIHKYLQSGHLDVDELETLFTQYKMNAVHAATTNDLREFFGAVFWDPHLGEDELKTMALALLPKAGELNPEAITDIVSVVAEQLDPNLARRFLDAWLSSVDSRPEYQHLDESMFYSPHRPFHPEVLSKMNAMRDRQHPPLTVVEAAERIITNSGWGEREQYSFRSSTVPQYEEALRDIKNDTLRRFLDLHLRWIADGPYDDNFKSGIDNFLSACTKIRLDAPDSRLSKIIYKTFQSKGLHAKLGPSSADVKSTPS
jgi:hypothetical protein